MNRKASPLKVEKFPDHDIISQPNPLKSAISFLPEGEIDDAIARAEAALDNLAAEFTDWMEIECKRLSAAHQALEAQGFSKQTVDELFRAAHDIKGDAATFGYPVAAVAAESLCRLIEYAPDFSKVPPRLITHHVEAINAIVREHSTINAVGVADELSASLCKLTEDYLADPARPSSEWLPDVPAPTLAPRG